MNSDLPPTRASFTRHRLGMGRAAAWSAAVGKGHADPAMGPGPDEDLATAALMTHLVLGQRHGWRVETRCHHGKPMPLGPMAVAWRAWKDIPAFALVLRPDGRWCSSNPAFWDEREPVRLHPGDVLQWWFGPPVPHDEAPASEADSGPDGATSAQGSANPSLAMAARVVASILDGNTLADDGVDLAFRQQHRGANGLPFGATVRPGKGARVLTGAIPRDGLGVGRATRIDAMVAEVGSRPGVRAVACHGTRCLPSVAAFDRWWAPVFGEMLSIHVTGLSDSDALSLQHDLEAILEGAGA